MHIYMQIYKQKALQNYGGKTIYTNHTHKPVTCEKRDGIIPTNESHKKVIKVTSHFI